MRVLFCPHSGQSLGHVIRLLAIAHQLDERGHSVLFSTSRTATPLVRKMGFDTFGRGYGSFLINGFINEEEARTTLDAAVMAVKVENSAIEKFRPHVVVGDPGILSAASSAEDRSVALVLHGLYLLATREVALPEGLTLSERIVLEKAIEISERVYAELTQVFRVKLGVELPTDYSDFLKDHEIVIPSLDIFEGLVTRDPRWHFVGPITMDSVPGLQQEIGRRLQRPMCYVCLGTGMSDSSWLRALVERISPLFRTIVVGSGSEAGSDGTDFSCKKVITCRFAPGRQVAEQADLVVCHGGHGTMMQVMLTRIPAVILPMDLDQAVNSILASRLGLGTVVGLERWVNDGDLLSKMLPPVESIERVAKTAERLLAMSDDHWLPYSLPEDGPSRAADLLEKMS